jgi:hypothetical protein
VRFSTNFLIQAGGEDYDNLQPYFNELAKQLENLPSVPIPKCNELGTPDLVADFHVLLCGDCKILSTALGTVQANGKDCCCCLCKAEKQQLLAPPDNWLLRSFTEPLDHNSKGNYYRPRTQESASSDAEHRRHGQLRAPLWRGPFAQVLIPNNVLIL